MAVRSLGTVLALNRTVGIVLISVLFFGLGEQLWSPFLPAYLEAKTSASGAQTDPAKLVQGLKAALDRTNSLSRRGTDE